MTEKKLHPFAQGQVADFEITDLNHRGEGVGKKNNFTLFVPQALPGESVRVAISAVRKNFAIAELVSRHKSSPHRVNPPCPYYPDCGGCQIQHLSYEKQLEWKKKRISETLRRIAGKELTVKPVLGMNEPWRYRNKAQIHIGMAGEQVTAGFYQQQSHQIINILDCLIQHPRNCEMINAIRRAALELINDEKTSTTGDPLPVNRADIRTSFTTGKSMVTLIGPARGENFDLKRYDQSPMKNKIDQMAELINKESKHPPVGIAFYQPGKKDGSQITLCGQSYLEEKITPFHYHISPRSFFQVNPAQAEILYEQAAFLSGKPATAYDLYCGTGNFSLYLSRAAEQVIGVDSDNSAIKDARNNAALNKTANIRFINARAEEIPDLLLEGKDPKTVFINPPRQGCSPGLLDAVVRAKTERIVYISCDPATLARDIGRLQQSNYAADTVQPVDMFPHTGHVECVALIVRK